LSNRQIEFARKLEVALIVRGNSLDRAGAVTKEDIISDPDWNFLAIRGIDRECAGEDAGFFFSELGPLEI